ncbi:hypothetical protein QZH41_018067 [Actinostola sp. cb2023]|nr:hypothetical protein QZH41_018067 [Actinostola sp. cb2023]
MAWISVSAISILLFSLLSFESVESGYLITTPRVYRTGTVQRLNVHLSGDDGPWNITASLKITGNNKLIAVATKSFSRGDSKATMEIKVPPSVPQVRYNQFNNVYLQVHGVAKGKPDFRNKQALTLEHLENTLFIQTDKPIYKPGQTIRMRVVGVKPDLKPLGGKSPTGTRMMQWNNMDFQNGIASVEMLLSKHPVLGEWKIQAQYKGKQVQKIIEVSKYVLPKFEVVIQPPSFIALDSKVVTGTICAKYTYGQLVTGKLKAVLHLKVQRRWHSSHNEGKKITIEKKIKGCYEFALTKKDFASFNHNQYRSGTLNITATMTEEATGVTRSATSTETKIQLHRMKLNFKIGTPEHFKPGLSFYGQVGHKAKINFQCTLKANQTITSFVYNLMCGGNVIVSEERHIAIHRKKNQVAEGSIVFPVTQAMVPSCRLLVYYARKDGETVADSMVIDVEDKLENQVVVRFSDNVRRPGEPVQITLTATTPGSTVALAGVDKSVRLLKAADDLNSDKVVNILSSHDVGPTNQYKRKQRCYKDNYVDSSKAFYDAGLIYLSDSRIDSRPCLPFPTWSPIPWLWRPWNVMVNSFGGGGGVSPRRKQFRNKKVKLQRKSKPNHKGKPTKTVSPPTVRKNFPETWMWTEETISNITGEKIITAKVPDTITSWYTTAFAMSSSTGMGVADPSTLKVFQPFFVSFTLPYSVIRGEQVSVVATVFNYMSRCSTVRIRLTKTDHFQLSSPGDQKLCVCGNEAKSVKYVITPVQLGHIPLKVTVQNVVPSLCENPSEEAPLGISDAVIRKLLVEPEGVRQEYTYSSFICPRDNEGIFHDELKFSLPNKTVQGSVYATVSVIGDLMGPSLTGLEGLLRLPTGCGEQNMVKFAPNIFIMQYLNITNQLTGDTQTKAVGFLRTGYQRELTYKRKDGSYSAFGDRDKEGSLWLTAFVLRSFSQARQFIFVDDEEIKFTTKWIESKQLDTGCFKKHGKLFHKELKGGVSTPVTLTAYVLISLLESKINPKSDVIVKALKCVTSQKDSVTDPYSNAIIAYALTLARHPDRGEFLKRLGSQAIVKDGQMHWEKKVKPKKQNAHYWFPPYHRSSSSNIEMTSYALMAMIGDGTDSKAIGDAMPIIRWISKQRNALGGFSSTQDTCVALQALARYAGYVYRGGTRMRIDVGYVNDKQFQHSFRINDNNRLVLQRVECYLVPQNILPVDHIPIDAFGDGCALLQADVLYNIPEVEEEPAFKLSVSVHPRKIKNVLN